LVNLEVLKMMPCIYRDNNGLRTCGHHSSETYRSEVNIALIDVLRGYPEICIG